MDGEISVDELQALRQNGDAPLVVDIRTPGAFARGHIPDSVNVPFPQLTTRVDDIADADHVVTVCPHGESSVQAARLVAAYEEFDGRVESLAEGLQGWDGPVESGRPDVDGDQADEGPTAPF